MIQSLMDRWNGLGIIGKVLAIIGLPLIILIAFTKAGRSVLFKIEENKQATVQKESNKLDAKIDTLKVETAKTEGHVEQLEKDKTDAVNQAETANPANFYNNRYKPTDK